MAVVTIIGGHGKVALLAEPLLVERGHTVNALMRLFAGRSSQRILSRAGRTRWSLTLPR